MSGPGGPCSGDGLATTLDNPVNSQSTAETLTKKLSYRADIDGLRAIAVLAVISSHLPEKFLPSGFLGVDVFFAISGFVVTASLLGQRRTKLSQLYVGFLARRIKRLMPALTLCVAVTGFVVLATDPFPRHSIQTGLAALFGFANIVLFFFELDYFSPSSIFNAFTHTWSLGVEEQFYVVFPMFAWLFYFRLQGNSFKPLTRAMVLGGLVSVALFAWLYEEHQAAAFFLMPTRIWELGVGALVFLASRRMQSTQLQEILGRLSPFALVALIVCFFAPESYAMPATLAAVGLAGLLLATDDRSPAARLLTLPPVIYIGRISYSLYLWHWPIIALGPIMLATAWRSSAVYVVATAVAAIISFTGSKNRCDTGPGRLAGSGTLDWGWPVTLCSVRCFFSQWSEQTRLPGPARPNSTHPHIFPSFPAANRMC